MPAIYGTTSTPRIKDLSMPSVYPNRRNFMATVGAMALSMPFLATGRVRAASSKRPNILFIMADDLGFADLSCYGQRDFTTPIIDDLAANGVRLTQGYANSAVCSATRTALVTGRYQYRFAVGLEEPVASMGALKLPDGTPTIASRFRALGYRTALIGKWHVGAPPEAGPTKYGYDYFWGMAYGAGDYFRHRADLTGTVANDGLYQNESRINATGYLTDLLADEASRWIAEDGDKPFLLSLHFNAPHWPWEGPADQSHSDSLKELKDSTGGSLRTYAEMVRSMDAAIGRVLSTLAALGLDRDTIVVFTSDNGGERFSNMWPLTGVKGELLEGGIRVPLIVRWPGRIKAGTVTSQVMTSMDFVPTLLAAAGATPARPGELDGENLLPQLLAEAATTPRQIFWRFKANEQAAVRDGDWKYLKIGGKEHLFDVAKDPRERADLKDVHPGTFSRLKTEYAAWTAQMLPYPKDSFSQNAKDFYADRY